MKNVISILCGILLFCLICSVPAACSQQSEGNRLSDVRGQIVFQSQSTVVFLFEVDGERFLVSKDGYLIQINSGVSHD